MISKSRLALVVLAISMLLLSACTQAPAVDNSAAEREAELQAQVDALQAQLDNAAAGGASEEDLAALQQQLEAAQAEASQAEADRAAAEAAAATAEAEAQAAAQAQCTYNAYRMGWVMDWADAGNIVDTVFGATSDFHYTFWQLDSPDAATRFTDLTTSAYRDLDQASRAATWQEAEKIVMDEMAAVLPIYHYQRATLISTDLSYAFPPFGSARFAQWSFNNGQTTLHTAVGTAVPTLDPQQATDTTSSFVIYQLLDAPYKFNVDGGVEPLAAESYEVSDDGRTYTVHLRQDAKWSDGQPVLAQHYVDGVLRLLSPDMANDYAYVMFDVEGAEEYNSGESTDPPNIRAVDDYTLEFTLKEPRSYFDSILAFSTFHPVRLDVIEQYGDDWTLAGNYPSNGAYVLVENNPGANLILEKNPEYWDADNVQIDRIEIDVIAEPATALAAFENGELDALGNADFPPEDTPRLVDTPEFVRTPRPGTYYLGFNLTAQHTNDWNFRAALSSAVDRETIINDVLQQPWNVPAYGVIPPEIQGYQGDQVGFQFDVEKAQEYLQAYMADAGITDPSTIVVELWYNKGGANQQILEAVEAMWEANLGIDVRTVNMEWATYLDTLEECNAIGGGGF